MSSATRSDVNIDLNRYQMLCAAWRYASWDRDIQFALRACPAAIQILAGHLTEALAPMQRLGLAKGYVTEQLQTQRLRGSIDFPASIASGAFMQRSAVCQVDALSLDILANRVLARALRQVLTVRHLELPHRRNLEPWRALLAEVPSAAAGRAREAYVLLGRSEYARPLYLCQLIDHWLYAGDGDERDTTFELPTSRQLRGFIFENYLRYMFKSLQNTEPAVVRKVSRPHLASPLRSSNNNESSWLPNLQTDMVIETPSEMILIEAKAYDMPYSLRGPRSQTPRKKEMNNAAHKLISSHLYQVQAYFSILLDDSSTLQKLSTKPWRACLVYAAAGALPPDLNYKFRDRFFCIRTLDLTLPWKHFENEAKRLIEPLHVQSVVP